MLLDSQQFRYYKKYTGIARNHYLVTKLVLAGFLVILVIIGKGNIMVLLIKLL